MTEDEFRAMALSLAGVIEASHMDHPDFRVGGKIFATLRYPGPGWGMVALTPDEQMLVVHAEPDVFAPAKGAWGRGGATMVNLRPRASGRSARRSKPRGDGARPRSARARPAHPRKRMQGPSRRRGHASVDAPAQRHLLVRCSASALLNRRLNTP